MGYAIVRPDGSSNRPIRNVRSWNAGGGVDGWSCVGGGSCRAAIDDMKYLDTVHGIVESILPIDANRVFATGLSNGGAISNRLACERPQRLAAIASVGGTNQFAAAGGTCPGDVSFLHIHGTDDPIWIYETDVGGLGLQNDGIVVGAEDTTTAWAERNGCSPDPISTSIADTEDDGTSSTRFQYQDCDRPVDLIRVDGGGHTWPQGDLYLSEGRIGKVAQDYDADDLILEFFNANPR
jgi:polyhydroxybutyrate depolymerase